MVEINHDRISAHSLIVGFNPSQMDGVESVPLIYGRDETRTTNKHKSNSLFSIFIQDWNTDNSSRFAKYSNIVTIRGCPYCWRFYC